MPPRRYPPAYLRYLNARLWNLGQPVFWVTAIFLSVVGLVTWEYQSKPNAFTRQQNNQVTSSPKPAESSLSAEDRAIVADIDNLPALFNDFEQANLPIINNTSKENTAGKKSKSLLDNLINKQKAVDNTTSNPNLGTVNNAPASNLTNPFVVQAENLLRLGTTNNNNQFLDGNSPTAASNQTGGIQIPSSLGIGTISQTNKNQNSPTISPLQAALNQSPNQKLPSFNGIASNQTNTLGQVSGQGATMTPPINNLPSQNLVTNTGTSSTQTQTNSSPNSYGNLNGNQLFPNVAPVSSPITSTVPTNTAPNANQVPSQNLVMPTNSLGSGSSSNYGSQQPIQLPQSVYGNYGSQQPSQFPQSVYRNYGSQQPSQLPQSVYGNYGLQQPSQFPQSVYRNYGSQQPSQLPQSPYGNYGSR